MRYESFIGLRYLRATRKQGFLSMITVISTIGVVIGVMTLNIVLAVFTGYQKDLRDRILSFNPHVIVLSFNGRIPDPHNVVRRVEEVPGVVAATPFVFGQVMLSAHGHVAGAVIRGIAPHADAVVNIEPHLRQGTVADLQTLHAVPKPAGQEGTVALPGLIVGKELARQLNVRVGERINVLSPLAAATAVGLVPRVEPFVVVGLFDSGMSEYDSSLAYMSLASAQRFFELDDAVTGIAVRGTNLDAAARLGARISAALGFPYRVRNWIEINHNLFAALKLGKTVYAIVLLLIVLVAAFNIVSTLIMVVIEKRKDIAVLKSMGATRAGVGRIFVLNGMIIGGVGTFFGNVGAFVACELLKHYRFITLPKDVYAIDRLAVKMVPEYFVAVSAVALVICLLATLYPARQAARLAPVDVIRYE